MVEEYHTKPKQQGKRRRGRRLCLLPGATSLKYWRLKEAWDDHWAFVKSLRRMEARKKSAKSGKKSLKSYR